MLVIDGKRCNILISELLDVGCEKLVIRTNVLMGGILL